MARIFTDKEIKAIMKALMVVWQEDGDHEQLGLNVALDMLCKVEVGDKMESLLNNEDNYEYHLHESNWFDENVADLLNEYHEKQQQEQLREQEMEELADKMKVEDLGNGLMKINLGGDNEQEQETKGEFTKQEIENLKDVVKAIEKWDGDKTREEEEAEMFK